MPTEETPHYFNSQQDSVYVYILQHGIFNNDKFNLKTRTTPARRTEPRNFMHTLSSSIRKLEIPRLSSPNCSLEILITIAPNAHAIYNADRPTASPAVVLMALLWDFSFRSPTSVINGMVLL